MTTFKEGDRVVALYDSKGLINSATNKPPYAPNGLPVKGRVYYVEAVIDYINPNSKNCGLKLLGVPIYNDGDGFIESNFNSSCFDKLESRVDR